jgi:hypothetical protein
MAMSICDRKQMAVLQTTKQRDSDPSVLVYLVWIARWNTCFCSKSKLSHAVCVHLFGVAAVVRKLGNLSRCLYGFCLAWGLLLILRCIFLIRVVQHRCNRFPRWLVQFVIGLLYVKPRVLITSLVNQVRRIIWIHKLFLRVALTIRAHLFLLRSCSINLRQLLRPSVFETVAVIAVWKLAVILDDAFNKRI